MRHLLFFVLYLFSAIPSVYLTAYELDVCDNILNLDKNKALISIEEINEKTSISLVLTSSLISEVNPGEVIYLSALAHNLDKAPFKGQLCITLPEGWQCFPSPLVDLSLEPNESKVLIYGVKVPKAALAGKHALSLSLEGCPNFQCSPIVIVKPHIDVIGTVNGLFETYTLNQKIQLSIIYKNRGNTPLNVLITTNTEPPCLLEYAAEPFEIPPYETFELPIILTPESCTEEYSQFLLVRLIDAKTSEPLYQNPMTLKLVAPSHRIDNSYIRIPAYIRSMFLGDRYKRIFATEFAGEGLIDSDKKRFIDFIFRIPTNVRHVIYNLDERLYAGMHDEVWDVRLGDTVYELSPLTQRYRYGRGAGIQHKWDQWEAGVHYTQNTLKCRQDAHELCSYMQFNPNENVHFSTNYLHKIEQNIPTSNILTLQSVVEFPNNITTDIEVGKNFVPRKKQRDNWAYRFETHGNFYNDSWFSFEKVYAGPQFYGYYNHLHLLSTSLDFPISNKMRINLNMDRLRQNFSDCNEDCSNTIIPRQHQYAFNLTYRLNQECSLALNGLWLRAQDLGPAQQYNFYQKWVGCSFFVSSQGYVFNAIASFGQQKDYLTHKTTLGLQRYYAYMYKNLSPSLRGSIFLDCGNINYYDARPWRSGYGGSLSYRFSPRGYFELFLQKINYTSDTPNIFQVAVNFNHTFKNLHKFQATAQYYRYQSHYPNDIVFLVSYSIPFSVPICRRKDIGDIEGIIYNIENDTRVSGALLECVNNRTTTDVEGCFAFRCLPTGNQCPNIEMLPDDLITTEKDKVYVKVPGGSKAKIRIPVIPSSSIRGEIILHGYKDIFAVLMDPSHSEIIPQEGLKNVQVAISRENGQEIYSCMTDEKGGFNFPKVRPGKWHIKIFTDQIPPLHELDMNNLILDVLPGEDKRVHFKALPSAPEVYKMSS